MMESSVKGQSSIEKFQELARAPTGIHGFDQSTKGGLPRGRTSLVIGEPGVGKTVFALQTLVNGARQWEEPGIFVAFEENSQQVIANAASFGWDLPTLEKDKLFFLDARMSLNTITAGQFDLAGMLASLEAKTEEMGAKRIVFDSLDVLLTLLNNPLLERQEVYRVRDWLSDSGLTGLVTARIGTVDPLHSECYGFLQFMADCVVQLSHQVEQRVSLRTLRTVKYRGSSYAENELPMVISPAGMEVGVLEQIELEHEVSNERLSTGIEPLDDMLAGGYFRGSSVLVSGAPGTAKSTLCGAFLEAACQRGERALYVSFDESASEITRNLASVGIRLKPHIDSELLRIYSVRTEARSADQHLLRLRALVDEHEPSCMAVDPISAMMTAGGGVSAMSMTERLLGLAKTRGITLLLTSLLAGSSPKLEATPIAISTIADTWVHLSYINEAGERNRALTIVKSRGTPHSNQVREMILSGEGPDLVDVYTSGGDVLMGTQRWEKEEAMIAGRMEREADLRRRKKQVELAEAEAQARIKAIQLEIESLRYEAAQLDLESEEQEKRWGDMEERIRRLRQGSEDTYDQPKEVADSESRLPEDQVEDR
jgi:circadian clock protein KaiC